MTFQEIVALALVLLASLAVAGMLSRLGRLLDRRSETGVVTFNGTFIQYVPPKKSEVRKVLWSELREVGILTTDAGPAVDDVFWMLVDAPERGCLIPSETAGMGELLKRLQALPGFDSAAVIEAMGSSRNAKFVCWVKPDEPATSSKDLPLSQE